MDRNTGGDAAPGRDDGRIPVTLLTGFLGAGKTTLLNRLTARADMAGTVLLINEFGEIGIDQHLVETLDEQTVILDSGCLCCSMNGDLIAALTSLHERMARREIPPIRRAIIETTGLADPVPVVNTLMENRAVSLRFVCDGVVTVVDATLGLEQLARHGEAVRQVSIADLLLVGKADLAAWATRARLSAELARLNPSARRVEMRHGDVAPDLLFGAGIYATDRATTSIDAWMGWSAGAERSAGEASPHVHTKVCGHDHGDGRGCAICDEEAPSAPHAPQAAHAHGDGIASFVVSFDAPVPWRGFAVAMGGIVARWGERLLRVKGLVRAEGEEAPVVVQCVQDNAYAPVKLPRWPSEGAFSDRRGRLVFIVDGLGADEVAEICARLADLPGGSASVQKLAAAPNLPTRCWLDARLPILHRGSFETDAWVVMPRRYTAVVRSA
ncbi:MAG: GTP-binding protein [Phyllobacteriaceae bacterium]|nr:GTP-binding protein [Phyllobacteriaceae bacterium]